MPYKVYGREHKFPVRMCNINGVKYILLVDLCGSTDIKQQLLKKGMMREEDFFYFHSKVCKNRYQIVMFIRLNDAIRLKDFFLRSARDEYEKYRVVYILEAADAFNPISVSIKEDDIMRSQVVYRKYRDMKRKSYNYNLDMKYQAEIEREQKKKEQRIDREKNNEKTLRDLVQQIEDMGWHVTLSMKNG